MLSLGGIKNFVSARQASARSELSMRLAVQNKAFYSAETQHARRVMKKYGGIALTVDGLIDFRAFSG